MGFLSFFGGNRVKLTVKHEYKDFLSIKISVFDNQ